MEVRSYRVPSLASINLCFLDVVGASLDIEPGLCAFCGELLVDGKSFQDVMQNRHEWWCFFFFLVETEIFIKNTERKSI